MFSYDEILGGRFRVLSLIGEGGFGEVYLVETSDKSLFALKTTRKDHLSNGDITNRFLKESSIWLDLNHPNIVKAYSAQELAGRLCLQIEYVPQNSLSINTLRQYLRFSPPNLKQILIWGIQFCSGMQHASDRGLVCHRDIKPENILITPNQTLKITDFGIGKLKEAVSESPSSELLVSPSSALTQGIIGTLSYMSPEQMVDSSSVDHLSDIYSFGIVLYELISAGRRPFAAISTNDDTAVFFEKMFVARLNNDFQPVESPMWGVVEKCLAYEMTERYQSFADVDSDLQSILLDKFGEQYIEPTRSEVSIKDLNDKAWSHTLLANNRLAREYLDQSMQLNPLDFRTIYYQGNLAVKNNKLDAAKNLFLKSISLKETAESWVSLGMVNRQLGDFEEAIRCYLKAIQLNRNLAHAWYNLAVCNLHQNYYKPAITALEATLKIDPSFHPAWVNLGSAFEMNNQIDESIEAYKSALLMNRSDSTCWFRLAVVFERSGQFEDAEQCYKECLQLESTFSHASFNLAMLLRRNKDNASAKVHFERFLQNAGDEDSVKVLLASRILRNVL